MIERVIYISAKGLTEVTVHRITNDGDKVSQELSCVSISNVEQMIEYQCTLQVELNRALTSREIDCARIVLFGTPVFVSGDASYLKQHGQLVQMEKEHMSLSLNTGSRPEGLVAVSIEQTVRIGQFGKQMEIEISMADFCELVVYVMTNTDLVAGDPRLNMMMQLAKLNTVPGFNPGGYRMGVSDQPGVVGH